jgi:hypothetical protein
LLEKTFLLTGIKRLYQINLILYISLILVIGSLFHILSMSLVEKPMPFSSIYAQDDGGGEEGDGDDSSDDESESNDEESESEESQEEELDSNEDFESTNYESEQNEQESDSFIAESKEEESEVSREEESEEWNDSNQVTVEEIEPTISGVPVNDYVETVEKYGVTPTTVIEKGSKLEKEVEKNEKEFEEQQEKEEENDGWYGGPRDSEGNILKDWPSDSEFDNEDREPLKYEKEYREYLKDKGMDLDSAEYYKIPRDEKLKMESEFEQNKIREEQSKDAQEVCKDMGEKWTKDGCEIDDEKSAEFDSRIDDIAYEKTEKKECSENNGKWTDNGCKFKNIDDKTEFEHELADLGLYEDYTKRID